MPEQRRETLLVPGSEPISVDFLCGGTGIKVAPFFLLKVGSRDAKKPPSLKWGKPGSGQAQRLCKTSADSFAPASLEQKDSCKAVDKF